MYIIVNIQLVFPYSQSYEASSRLDPDWAEKLVLPVRFSVATSKVLDTGLLTKKARVEIITALSTLMLVHTSRPTPRDLTIVSRRLVEKHPKLKDKVDNGYVSLHNSTEIQMYM